MSRGAIGWLITFIKFEVGASLVWHPLVNNKRGLEQLPEKWFLWTATVIQ